MQVKCGLAYLFLTPILSLFHIWIKKNSLVLLTKDVGV
jgi:hypothetical protein